MDIMIVEDEIISSKKLSEILSPYGECKVFYDGKSAIAYYSKCLEKNHNIDLITLDIAMPEFDGVETLIELRAIEKENGISTDNGAKIIMVTSSFDKDKITECFAQSCNDYIIKPFDENKIISRLKNNRLI